MHVNNIERVADTMKKLHDMDIFSSYLPYHVDPTNPHYHKVFDSYEEMKAAGCKASFLVLLGMTPAFKATGGRLTYDGHIEYDTMIEGKKVTLRDAFVLARLFRIRYGTAFALSYVERRHPDEKVVYDNTVTYATQTAADVFAALHHLLMSEETLFIGVNGLAHTKFFPDASFYDYV